MKRKEVEERIRLLEYENQELRFELDEIKKQLKPIRPMFPFDAVEMHSMGCSWKLPDYNQLKAKYRANVIITDDPQYKKRKNHIDYSKHCDTYHGGLV